MKQRPAESAASNKVVPRTLPWPKKCLAGAVYLLIRLIAPTLRTRLSDPYRSLPKLADRQVIFCVWHNRLALALPAYYKFLDHKKRQRRLAALVSASRDGAIVAFLLELFKAQPVRGSSSRRGAQAILELTTCASNGLDLALTPDGPRGPRYKIQDGAIALGQLTRLPILPVSFHLSRKLELKSWDRFQIPIPFGRWTVHVGQPMEIPEHPSDAEREQLRAELESRMLAITHDGREER